MKTKLLLGISLFANIIMLVILCRRPASSEAVSKPSGVDPALARTVRSQKVAPQVIPPENTNLICAWANIESSDYSVYIANLRAIGCPQQTIQDIIIADVTHLFAGRSTNLFKQLLQSNQYEFWRTASFDRTNQTGRGKYEKELTMLNKERIDTIDQLVNVRVRPDDLSWAPRYPGNEDLRKSLDFIASEKRPKVESLMKETAENMQRILKPGDTAPEVMAELARLRRSLDAELNSMLSPQEKLDFDLRNSPLAQNLRRDLDRLNPTENEFSQIFQLRKSTEDAYGNVTLSSTTAEIEQRIHAEAYTESKLKDILGSERYEEYLRGKDQSYRKLLSFLESQNMSQESASRIYAVEQAIESTVVAVRTQPDARDPTQFLSRMREEAERELTAILGLEGFRTYRNGSSAGWLRRLDSSINNGELPGVSGRTLFVPAAK